MSTPVDKLKKIQTIKTKKKTFFRILQSSPNYDHNYCAIVNDEKLKNELESSMKQLIMRQHNETSNQLSNNDDTVNINNNNIIEVSLSMKKSLSKKKLKKLEQKKTFKNIDIVYGLNQVMKLLQSNQLSMVWLDRDTAENLMNVFHKLCSVNKVHCIDLNLENMKQLFNLSTLTVVGFKAHVQQDNSMFNSIYQLLIKSLFTTKSPTKNNAKINENQDNNQNNKLIDNNNDIITKEEQPNINNNKRDINFYFENSSDNYSLVMQQRLKQSIKCDNKNEFRDQISFIPISQNLYFPNYYNKQRRFNFEIVAESKLTKEDSNKSANKFTENLFGIDIIDQQIKFHSPNLIKGQVDIEKVSKRKNKIKEDVKGKKQKTNRSH